MSTGSVIMFIASVTLAGARVAAASTDNEGLSWESCSTAPSNRTFACDTNAGSPFELVMWLVPFAWNDPHEVSGADAFLLIQSVDAVLPAWWQIDPGRCRPGAATLEFASPVPAGCADAWGGLASGTIQYWPDTYCGPKALQLDLVATMPAGQSRVLSDGRYAFFRLRISRAGTVGSGSCEGCAMPVCFSTGGMHVFTPQGGYGYSTFSVASWQGGSCRWSNAYCPPLGTPARASTWGAIKAIYR